MLSNNNKNISAYLNGKAFTVTFKVTDVFSTATGNPKTLGLNRESKEEGSPFADTVKMNPGTSYTMKYDKKSGFDPKKAAWIIKDADGGEVSEKDRIVSVANGKVTALNTGETVLWGYLSEADSKQEDKEPAVRLTVKIDAVPAKSITYLNGDHRGGGCGKERRSKDNGEYKDQRYDDKDKRHG